MMTASWGGLGHLYNKPVAFCFINPTRHTVRYMETHDTYTLSFYTETYREALNYCGSHSGRNEDKVQGSGLTPLTTPSGQQSLLGSVDDYRMPQDGRAALLRRRPPLPGGESPMGQRPAQDVRRGNPPRLGEVSKITKPDESLF